MTRDYARSPIGERVVGIVPHNRGVVLTVVGAVALNGVRAMMAYEGSTSGDAFVRFCKEALAPSGFVKRLKPWAREFITFRPTTRN
jgi:hypothetical protein